MGSKKPVRSATPKRSTVTESKKAPAASKPNAKPVANAKAAKPKLVAVKDAAQKLKEAKPERPSKPKDAKRVATGVAADDGARLARCRQSDSGSRPAARCANADADGDARSARKADGKGIGLVRARARSDKADGAKDGAAPPGKAANGKAKEQLITLGKSKGFLTYDDVHEALPGEDVGAEQMDDVLNALDDEDIEVVDDASNIKIAPRRAAGEDEVASQAGRQGRAGRQRRGPAGFAAAARQRHRRRLLQEQRPGPDVPPQDGQRRAAHARGRGRDRQAHRGGRERGPRRRSSTARSRCARSSTSASGCKKHKIRVKDIVRDAEDEEHEFDEEEADRRIIRLIERVKRLDKKNQDLLEERKTAHRAAQEADRQGDLATTRRSWSRRSRRCA